ncbi:TPA: biotin/lipoyl-binding protein, partial [Vibrio cholerae O1]
MNRNVTAAALTGIVLLAGCGGGKDQPLVGMSEGRELAVAAKLAGRLSAVRCEEGDTIRAGDTVAMIGSPEVNAKVLQAEGAVRSAEAKLL